MGRRLRTRVLYGAAVASLVMLPVPVHADDIWCAIFNVGCGGAGSTTQSATERDAPEIDAGVLANAIALAVGGAALLRDRGRRRRDR